MTTTTKDGHHHRSSLKQKNKPFKGGSGSSRSKSRGRVERITSTGGGTSKPGRTLNAAALSKADRRNQAKLLAAAKRTELVQERKLFAGRQGTPRTVAIVPLSPSVELGAVLEQFQCQAGRTEYIEAHRQNLRWMLAPFEDWSVLDRLATADILLFVVHAADSSDLSMQAYEFLSVLRAQGVSSALALIQPTANSALSKELRAEWIDRLTTELPCISRVFTQAAPESRETAECFRMLCSQRLSGISWRERRPYLLMESLEYNQERQELNVTGFGRGGQPFSADRLVHIPGFGAFEVERIRLVSAASSRGTMEVDEMVQIRDPSSSESLHPTDNTNQDTRMEDEDVLESMQMADARQPHDQPKKTKVRVPKGTSSYQAAWLGEVLEDDDDEDDEDEQEDVELSEKSASEGEEQEDGDDNLDQMEDDPYEREAHRLDPDSRLQQLFPDRIAIPPNQTARGHLTAYRGLQSLRTAAWDPEEGLPAEYSQIYQFADPARSIHKALNGPVTSPFQPGQLLSLTVSGVSAEQAQAMLMAHQRAPLVLYGLLPHEQRTSLLHFTVSPRIHSLVSGEPVVVWLGGFRRFTCRPVYSEHNPSAPLHRLMRRVEPGMTAVATIYAPIHYGPGPALVFGADGTLISASGSLLGPDPRRIILERATLTGAPYKVHRRACVVRWMFDNAADVAWFKPVELTTRTGRRGHVKASVGTHGHFKALFDKPLGANEPIAMHLYRRVFPAWDSTQPL